MNNINMGIGWILLKDNNVNEIWKEFSASNFGWSSSTKAEITAVYSALLVTTTNANVKIYTDSANTITQYNSFKNEKSPRRRMKINQHITWEAIFYIIKKYKLSVEIIKVKAHDGNEGNDKADILAKKGLDEDRLLFRDIGIENNFRLSWYGTIVENNNRKFVKELNIIRRELNEIKLKRFDEHKNIDKRLSYKILNTNKSNESKNRKFLTMKENKAKNFKFKKMLDELPTLEKLKIRNPKVYKKETLCVLCNKKIETLPHLWECLHRRNEIVYFEREIKEWLATTVKDSQNFRHHDQLLDELYKYTRFEITLKDMNTLANTKYYRDKGYFDKRKTYIWDGNGSLDNIIKGWIPFDLTDIFKKYQLRSNFKEIEKIIIEWANKTNTFFEQKIWKGRNERLISWEKNNNITIFEKKKKNLNKRTVIDRKKRSISGRRLLYFHTVDEAFTERVKIHIGMKISSDFQYSQDERVLFRVIIFRSYVIYIINITIE